MAYRVLLSTLYTSLKQIIKNYVKNYEYRNVFYFEFLEMAFKLHISLTK